ncbi:LptF/LptG family permease [Gemmatimonas groenlandica]|uniref:YjgP/YjgQ family permease n=1 Tax=Gemmatimonas groenlandica TaxID=2732249 RepID=A0A6M4IHG8_9BACT|nr:LptF/LptG family permease [Gemmatimonas groenlandica]QJR34253.1 YjgP/YjgQ family permease [Gemmatimonas groenlandica]
MKLVTRYVVREHVGPLLFALSALTSLLMLQYVARQLANLAGKGLPWSAIGKFFVLSLPFTVAMTMPMAVLVATLYTFGRMAAEHEITAFKASGVRVRTLMLPVLTCAFLLSIAMVAFNDQVLPRANHELRILQNDIAKTKPTLALRDQAMNAITDQFFMRIARSDANTNKMYDVVIYDLTRGPERKTIYADSGVFSLTSNGQDLLLRLFDGYTQEFVRGDAKRLQRSFFIDQTVKVRGITRGFESTSKDDFRSDREMTVCEMHRRYAADALEFRRVRQEYIMYASRLVAPGTKTLTAPRDRPPEEGLSRFYCVTLPSLFLPKKAKAQAPVVSTIPQAPVVTPQGAPVIAQPGAPVIAQPGDTLKKDTLGAVVPTPPPAVTMSAPIPPALDTVTMYRGAMNAADAQLVASREGLDSLTVEIHKKFALSFACLVFVLFGPPIALRFPRGGVGVTIGVSIGVFGLYYVCLMGGEALADKGLVPPSIAMWIANAIFTVTGVVLLWRVESTTDTSRGGGIRDWWADRGARRALATQMKQEQAAKAAGKGSAAAVGA